MNWWTVVAGRKNTQVSSLPDADWPTAGKKVRNFALPCPALPYPTLLTVEQRPFWVASADKTASGTWENKTLTESPTFVTMLGLSKGQFQAESHSIWSWGKGECKINSFCLIRYNCPSRKYSSKLWPKWRRYSSINHF